MTRFRVFTLLSAICMTTAALANHPVLVEGNCDSPVPGTTIVTAGTCGDFDGDGRIGTAEDTDGADRIFGTIAAALGAGTGAAAGTGANQNGTVTIVTSGRFPEMLSITPASGFVLLEAAPGVKAQIDAVLQGDPAGGNATRQSGIGILVSASSEARVVLRNLTVRNFLEGIRATGDTRLTIDNVNLESNVNYGFRATNNARIVITDSYVTATGYRVSSVGTCPSGNCIPNPGHGIAFDETATGRVYRTTISGSYGAALVCNGPGAVQYAQVVVGHNGAGPIINATRGEF